MSATPQPLLFIDGDEPLPPKPSFLRQAPASGPVEPSLGASLLDTGRTPARHVRNLAAGLGKGLFYLVSVTLALSLGVGGSFYWEARQALGELQAGEKKTIVREASVELNIAPRVDAETSLKRLGVAPAVPLAATEATTILLIGSDRRWGETTGRSDTMMLVRLNPDRRTVSILSIPRDLRVPIPGHGYDKVNAAFAYGGAALLIETLREYFGVPINHFVETNFRGFGQIVSALGGVYVPVDGRYYVPPEADHMEIDLQPGYQLLNAGQALSFSRFRHYDSDFYRAARQQLFIREAERQIVASKYDYDRMKNLIWAFARATASDISSLGEIWRLAEAIHKTPADRVSREVVPANSADSGGVSYLDIDSPERQAVIQRWLHPEQNVRKQNISNTVLSRKPASKPVDVSLVSDGGEGMALIKALDYAPPQCALTQLPSGYSWGSSSPMRTYQLAGHPALAGWISAGSGRSVLLMETTWTEAPVLWSPTKSLSRGGRDYDVWYESGRIRQLSWRLGPTVAWLTNTLRNELSNAQMLALAASCEPVRS